MNAEIDERLTKLEAAVRVLILWQKQAIDKDDKLDEAVRDFKKLASRVREQDAL